VSLLRLRASLGQAALRCQWVLVGAPGETLGGECRPAELPRRAGRVQLVLPAAEVLITRTRLPQSARRRSGPILAFAIEEETLREPDASQVSWLGRAGDTDVLAVIDRVGLERWRGALEAAGITAYEVHTETLLLPLAPGEWSLAWHGGEGFVRTGPLEGSATDSGDRGTPPLALRLLLETAHREGRMPAAIAVYATAPDAAPDLDAWARELGVALRAAGTWDWRSAPADAGVPLALERRRWRIAPGLLARLRPAAWIAGAALALHALALTVTWAALAGEQRTLRARMEARFRALYPNAVAVVDPALQMRRKLAEARHATGQPDPGDFLPMLGQTAAGLGDLPAGALHVVSYEGGRMTLELGADQAAAVRRAVGRLNEAGLSAEAAPRAGGATLALTVRTP
jgi:general secretion pathway protein L